MALWQQRRLPLMWTSTRNQLVEIYSPLLSCYLLWGFFFSSIECSFTYLIYWKWSWGYIKFLFTEMCIFLSFNYYLLFLALLSSHSIYSKYKYSQGYSQGCHIGTFHNFSADILEFQDRGEAVKQDTTGGLSSPSKWLWGCLNSVLLSITEITNHFLIWFKAHSAAQSSCLVLLTESNPCDWLCHMPWGELSTNFLLNGHSNKLLLSSWLYTHISVTFNPHWRSFFLQ